MEYDIKTWGELFEQIGYAYESRYGVKLWEQNGVRHCTFYKLTLSADGWAEYKGQRTSFDPKLWGRVELLATLFDNENTTIDVLYGRN